MRLNEFITEDKQQLDEGPIGSLGKAVGKGVGGLAKGVGAVAGGIAGIGKAVKKGFQSGKATVAGEPDPNAEPAAPTGGGGAQPAAAAAAAPAGGGGGAAPAQQPAQQPAAPTGGGGGTAAAAQPAAAPAGGGGSGAAPAQQPVAKAGQPAQQPAAKAATPYKAAQDAVSKLDKRGKQNLLKLLQKEFPQAAPAAAAQPAAAPAAKPAASKGPSGGEYDNLGFGFDGNTGKPFKSQAEREAGLAREKAAAAAASAKSAQQPAAEPAADSDAGKPGFLQSKIKGRRSAAKPSQAEIDAERERVMGPTSDSIIRTGYNLSEALAAKVKLHKKKMFEQNLKTGQTSIFVK